MDGDAFKAGLKMAFFFFAFWGCLIGIAIGLLIPKVWS